MAETLVKFKTGAISDLATKKTVDSVEYPAVPLDSGTVYFVLDDTNTIGHIVYDYALDESGQSISEWSSSSTYAKDAEVLYNGKYYKSFVASNKGHAPFGEATSYDYWREVAARVVMSTNADFSEKTAAIPYGKVDSTSTSTVFTATIAGITELKDGVTIILENGVVTSAAGFTLNINSLGAKPVYTNLAAATAETTKFNVNYTMMFVYDSNRIEGGAWLCYNGYDSNTNTIGYQLRTNSSTRAASDTGYRYRLWFTSADGTKWVPANTSSSTNATGARTMNTRPINPFGPICYYSTNGTTTAGNSPSATTMWQQYTLTIGYSYMQSGFALVSGSPVYVKCAPQTDGSAVMESIVTSLPSSKDGKIYIYLGQAYSTTAMELRYEHPIYWHDGTGIRLWTGAEAAQITVDSALSSSSENPVQNKVINTALGGKQATLVSGTNIKTVNGNSLLGSGDVTIDGSNIIVNFDEETVDYTLDAALSAVTSEFNNLASVAYSGNYTDLSNKPTIPTVPANVSAFTNDAGYLTSADIPEGASAYTGTISAVGTTASAGSNNGFARGDHVHNITDTTITSALGYTPYNSTNPNGYTTNTGTVTSVRVQATSPVSSSVSTAQTGTLDTTISLANNYGDTKNPYASKTKNYVLAAPANAAGVPSFRALVAADIPDLSGTYLTSYTETDPVFGASAASGITASDITNWNGKTSNTGTITSVKTTAGAHTAIDKSSGAVSFNVPTKTSHLTNDSGFLTTTGIPTLTNNGGKILAVNSGGTAMEWVTKPTSVTYTAGTGIDITNGVISINLSNAESESF